MTPRDCTVLRRCKNDDPCGVSPHPTLSVLNPPHRLPPSQSPSLTFALSNPPTPLALLALARLHLLHACGATSHGCAPPTTRHPFRGTMTTSRDCSRCARATRHSPRRAPGLTSCRPWPQGVRELRCLILLLPQSSAIIQRCASRTVRL